MRDTVLITGASSGIGYELAKVFAREGYDLVITARNKEALLSLKSLLTKKYQCKVWVYDVDLAQIDGVTKLYQFTKEHNITIDILVNNAGFGKFGDFLSFHWQSQWDMIQLNITALTELTHLYVKDMVQRKRGKVMNVASLGSFQPGPYLSTYYASKAYVLSFTEALSVELGGTGVTAMALCPGPTRTNFVKRASLKRSGLFKNMKVSTPTFVAEYGYSMLKKNKIVAIPGVLNKLGAFASKVLPRSIIRQMVYIIQK